VAVPRHVPAPSDVSPHLQADDLAELARRSPLPASVSALPKAQVASVLWHIWRDQGLVDSDESGAGVIALLPATTADLATVSRLLLRFGITTTVHDEVLRIVEVDDQRRFLQEIGQPGADAARMLRRALSLTAARREGPVREAGAWAEVERLVRATAAAHVAPTGAGSTGTAGDSSLAHRSAPAPLLGELVKVLDADALDVTATNDVYWDTVVSVEPDGVEEVFDATVLGTHNFVADGIAVHNSIEQDADMVVLLHREELYERESPRAGEADFIVAKHRNGPTATITVAFQGHYSRFVDIAQH
jgi:replicative DNA helicase